MYYILHTTTSKGRAISIFYIFSIWLYVALYSLYSIYRSIWLHMALYGSIWPYIALYASIFSIWHSSAHSSVHSSANMIHRSFQYELQNFGMDAFSFFFKELFVREAEGRVTI